MPLPSSGLIVVENTPGILNANSKTVSFQNFLNKSHQLQQKEHNNRYKYIVDGVAETSTKNSFASASSLTTKSTQFVAPLTSLNSATVLSKKSSCIDYTSNDARTQNREKEQQQQKYVFTDRNGNNSNESSNCKSDTNGETALKTHQNVVSKSHSNISNKSGCSVRKGNRSSNIYGYNCINLGSHSKKTGSNSSNATALVAATSGIHRISFKTQKHPQSQRKKLPFQLQFKSKQVLQVHERKLIERPTASNRNKNSITRSCDVRNTAVNGSKINMILSTTSEMINQQQVYKIVAADGSTSNMIIDNLRNVTPTGVGGGGASGGNVSVAVNGVGVVNNNNNISSAAVSNNTSKILLGNLTVLSKQNHMNTVTSSTPSISTTSGSTSTASVATGKQKQPQSQAHPQTINFVSAKNLSYLTTVSSAPNSYGSNGKHKFTLSSTPYKNNSKHQLHQQQHHMQASSPTTFLLQQQHHQQKLSTSGSTSTVPVPVTTRPVQMMTRVQTLMQPSSLLSGSSILQQQQSQILLQHPPSKHLTTSSNKLHITSSSTNSNINISNSNLKKSAMTSGSLKKPATNKLSTAATTSSMVHHHTVSVGGLGVKTTFIPQQQHQNQHYQTSNSMLASGTSFSGLGIGFGIGGNATVAKPKTSSKLVKQYNNAINNSASSLSTYTINQQKFGNNTISQQQQQNSSSSTTKITKLSNKYILHQPQTQHQHPSHLQQHILNLPHGTQLQHKGVLPALSSTAMQNHFSPSSASITSGTTSTTSIYQRQSSSSSGGGITTTSESGAAIAPAGTIKFVNAHGTVIQQHPGTQTLALHSHTVTSTVTATTTTVSALPSANIATVTSIITPLPSSSSSSSNTTPLFADDIVIVNGTQMTDELSARILQSMSQKSYCNSQLRYQEQQKLSASAGSSSINNGGGNMPPPTSHQQQQISNIIVAPKEYQLFNPVQSGPSNVTQPTLASPSMAPISPVSPCIHQHIVVSSASSSIVTQSSSSAGSLGSIPDSSMSISYMTTPSSLATSASALSTGRQVYNPTGSRSHSVERKLNENSQCVKTDVYKNSGSMANDTGRSNSTGVNSVPSASLEQQSFQHHTFSQQNQFNQVIQLQALKTKSTTSPSMSSIVTTQPIIPSGVNDDDIIGEEIRPVPVITQDVRLQILHAVLQDHTYANAMPMRLPTDFNVHQMLLQQQPSAVVGDKKCNGNNINLLMSVGSSNNTNPSNVSQYMASLTAASLSNLSGSPTAASVTATQQWVYGGSSSSVASITSSQQQQHFVHSPYTTLYGQSIPRLQQQDDDAHSAISNGSREALGDIDPGEETETAPEAEAEDDSITRCICDFTHDDGYMICCDKCSAWQHVDCMVVDRSNIPDEYLCELCQPRDINKSRARALQILKRKQQSQAVLTVQTNSSSNPSLGGVLAGVGLISYDTYINSQHRLGSKECLMSSSCPRSNSNLNNSGSRDTVPHKLSNTASEIGGASAYLSGNSYSTKKCKFLKKTKDLAGSAGNLPAGGRKSKKSEKLAAAALAGNGGSVSGNMSTSTSPSAYGKSLRKESRKNTKRKTKAFGNGFGGDANSSGGSGANTAAGKHAANLRHWIENYELAVTNHYSPELRARLQAINKQPSLLQSITNTENKALKDCGNLENRATTVPHAGGKILISSLDIAPSYPIFELRGKYMLTTQYKTQNPSVNMNTPPPSNYQLIASHKAHKTPGPFIFFYQLPGAEAPMQTMNPDGSYPHVPPQPAYLKGPEICVDTRTYGNEARFVRRSCRPNAEIQHLFEKGTIHLFLVSLTTIRASTEITIRHEPHDIQAVETRKSNALVVKPTSTACACGLTNDCLFGPPLPKQTPGTAKPGRKSTQLRSDKMQSSAVASQLTSGATGDTLSPSQIGNGNKKKSVQGLNRNRSTSSSGDSTMGSGTGFQSPNISQMHLGGTIMVGGGTANPSNLKTVTLNNIVPNNNILALSGCGNSTSSMHDSGICTSSSSPSVSIPSPTPQHIHSPTQQQQQTTVLHRTPIMQQQNPQQQQMLASLPPTMLLTEQINTQKQQPLTVITASTSLQLPVANVNVGSNNCSGKYTNNHNDQQRNASEQVHQQKSLDGSMSLQHQPNANSETSSSTADLQLINSVKNLTEMKEKQTSPKVQVEQRHDHDCVQQTAGQEESEESDSREIATSHCAQKKQRHSSGSTHQRNAASQSYDQHVSSIDTPSKTSSTLLKPQQKQHQQPVGSSRKTSGGNKHTRNVSDSNIANRSSSTAQHGHQNKNSDISSGDFTTVPTATYANSSSSSALIASTPNEKPKLSREDRKMEAILKAIEKMERTQQRKKEAKASKAGKQRQSEAVQRASANSSSEFPETTGSGIVSSKVKRATNMTRKKKRKSNKSYGGANVLQRKRQKNRICNNGSDADAEADPDNITVTTVTSESEGMSLLSPNIPTTSRLALSSQLSIPDNVTTDSLQQPSVDQAAGLLMALACHSMDTHKCTNTSRDGYFKSAQLGHVIGSVANVTGTPQSGTISEGSLPATPPAPVSSACLLIEAAVAPLDAFAGVGESEFKFPSKAKTKKSLMSNWLQQSDIEACQLPGMNTACASDDALGLESLVQAAMNDFDRNDKIKHKAVVASSEVKASQQLSDVAMQVEEFIFQTERSSSPTDEIVQKSVPQHQIDSTSCVIDGNLFKTIDNKFQEQEQQQLEIRGGNNATVSPNAVRNLHVPLNQVSTCSNNSSVKKRWLRQAISEETDETSSSVVSVPLNTLIPHNLSAAGCNLIVANGFTTPLKKRRLVINEKGEENDVQKHIFSTETLRNDEQASNNEKISMVDNTSEEELDAKDIFHTRTDDCEIEARGEIVGVASENQLHLGIVIESKEESHTLQPQSRTKGASKQFINSQLLEQSNHVIKGDLIHLAEQDDEVDVLRSPSPVQKSIAEDNLVKIKPEDVCGDEDIKIDVEREESLTIDNFEEIVNHLTAKKEEQNRTKANKDLIFIKADQLKVETDICGIDINKVNSALPLYSKRNNDDDPRFVKCLPCLDINKTMKIEKPVQEKSEFFKKLNFKSVDAKNEPIEKKLKLCDDSPHSSEVVLGQASTKCASDDIIGRQQLSDDDIQDRLSLFHQENILLLQKRNKQQPVAETITNDKKILTHTNSKTVTPDYNKFELDTVKPSPLSPSLQLHPFNEILYMTSSTVSHNSGSGKFSSSIKSVSKQSPASYVSSSTSKKAHKRDRCRDRDRERDRGHREHSYQRERGRQRERNRSYDRSRDRERGRSYNRSYDRERDAREIRRTRSRERSYDRSYSHEYSRDRSYDRNRSRDHSRERSRERAGNCNYYYSGSSSKFTNSIVTSHVSYAAHYSNSSTISIQKKGQQSSSTSSSSKNTKKILSSSTLNTSGGLSAAPCSQGTHNSSSITEKGNYRTMVYSTVIGSTNIQHSTQPQTSGAVPPSIATTSTNQGISNNSNRKRLNFEQENTQNSGKYYRREDRGREYTEDKSNINESNSNASKHRLRDNEPLRPSFSTQRSMPHSMPLTTSVLSTSASNAKPSCAVTATTTSTSCSPTLYSIPVISSGTAPMLLPVIDSMHAPQLSSVHAAYSPLQAVRIVREHPTIPHFNNPLTVISSGEDEYFPASNTANMITTSVSSTSGVSTSANIHSNFASRTSTDTHSTSSSSMQLPTTCSYTTCSYNHSITSTTQLPFYNTVYRKLLNHITPSAITLSSGALTSSVVNPVAAAPLPPGGENITSITSVASSTQPGSTKHETLENAPVMSTSSTEVNPSVSETAASNYFDAKLKSYGTLSGYVSHSALFGLGNMPKLSGNSSSASIGRHTAAGFGVGGPSDSSNLTNSLDEMIPVSTSVALGKFSILTKTASHDPRLNPILSAPEPPTVPKRKLSINEYRRRMKQSTSSSSPSTESPNISCTTTTKPDVQLCDKTSSTIGKVPSFSSSSSFFKETIRCSKSITSIATNSAFTTTMNRCSLNSPERFDNNSTRSIIQRNTLFQKTHEKTPSFNSKKSGLGGFFDALESPPPLILTSIDEELKTGQFNAAPTLLEKQQEKLCERLKTLKSQNNIIKENQTSAQECDKKISSFMIERSSSHQHHIHKLDNVSNIMDNCFEPISSTSSSLESSLNSSPERNFTTNNYGRPKDEFKSRLHQKHSQKKSNISRTTTKTSTSGSTTMIPPSTSSLTANTDNDASVTNSIIPNSQHYQ